MTSAWGALTLVIPAAAAATHGVTLTSVECWEGGLAIHTASSANELDPDRSFTGGSVDFEVSDDLGTEYKTIGGGARGSPDWW